ncbi:hypothetical protein NDU88_000362 [Pleurodeles waltl]|uniref:Uncharacterized protein n=1 Tax=Pleurodeles waltl TaxID=8319 RepID=A0AAV7MHH9_PLEWA|nr:hypothetical protein NDU88_000362 [Pleurodeles waltl]
MQEVTCWLELLRLLNRSKSGDEVGAAAITPPSLPHLPKAAPDQTGRFRRGPWEEQQAAKILRERAPHSASLSAATATAGLPTLQVGVSQCEMLKHK